MEIDNQNVEKLKAGFFGFAGHFSSLTMIMIMVLLDLSQT